MSNQTDAKAIIGGHLLTDKGGETTVNNLTDITASFFKSAADSMAADATASTWMWTNPYDFSVQVVGATITPISTLTAHASNNASIIFSTSDGAAGAAAAAITFTTTSGGTGSWVALTKIQSTASNLTQANCTIPAGGSLHFSITKAASGVVVPISGYTVRLRKI